MFHVVVGAQGEVDLEMTPGYLVVLKPGTLGSPGGSSKPVQLPDSDGTARQSE